MKVNAFIQKSRRLDGRRVMAMRPYRLMKALCLLMPFCLAAVLLTACGQNHPGKGQLSDSSASLTTGRTDGQSQLSDLNTQSTGAVVTSFGQTVVSISTAQTTPLQGNTSAASISPNGTDTQTTAVATVSEKDNTRTNTTSGKITTTTTVLDADGDGWIDRWY